jgi:hypothetical protein
MYTYISNLIKIYRVVLWMKQATRSIIQKDSQEKIHINRIYEKVMTYRNSAI